MHPQLIALDLAGHPLIIGSYGALLCVAVAIAAFALLRAAHADGHELGAAISAVGTAVGAGLLGAVLVHGAVVGIERGSLAVALSHPGMSLFGALLGGGAGFALSARALALPGLAILDRA